MQRICQEETTRCPQFLSQVLDAPEDLDGPEESSFPVTPARPGQHAVLAAQLPLAARPLLQVWNGFESRRVSRVTNQVRAILALDLSGEVDLTDTPEKLPELAKADVPVKQEVTNLSILIVFDILNFSIFFERPVFHEKKGKQIHGR